MAENRSRFQRHAPPAPSAGFGWMVLASMAVHVLAAGIFGSGLHLPKAPSKPTYRVDLVSRPVPRPQAGRPDGVERITPDERPAPTAPAPAPPKAKPPAGKALTAARKETKPPPSSAASAAQAEAEYSKTLAAIERMKEKKQFQQDVQALKDRIAQMHAEETERRSSTPLGEAGGRGDQAGSQYAAWIRAQIKSYWVLPPALVASLNLEAEVEIEFNARGARTRYHFLESSRDARFDDSIRRALMQLDQLPTPPGEPLSLSVKFNLKDLMER